MGCRLGACPLSSKLISIYQFCRKDCIGLKALLRTNAPLQASPLEYLYERLSLAGKDLVDRQALAEGLAELGESGLGPGLGTRRPWSRARAGCRRGPLC